MGKNCREEDNNCQGDNRDFNGFVSQFEEYYPVKEEVGEENPQCTSEGTGKFIPLDMLY